MMRRKVLEVIGEVAIGAIIGIGLTAMLFFAPVESQAVVEPPKFQAWNGQWYTQEDYEQMMSERQAVLDAEAAEEEEFIREVREAQERMWNQSENSDDE